MAEPKTKPTTQSPAAFLMTVEPAQKREDSLTLLKMFEKITGEKAEMWGTSIVGFGSYVLKKGKREDRWPLVAFSPRAQNLTLYIVEGTTDEASWKALGKHKISGSCLHINKLSDVDLTVLESLISRVFTHRTKTLG
jgi:hypothetical protein